MSPCECSWFFLQNEADKIFFFSPLFYSNYKIREQQSLEDNPGGHLVWSPLLEQGELGQIAQGCVQGFGIPPAVENPQPPWATCYSVQLPSQQKSVMFRSGSLYFSLCPLLLSCHWAPLRRIWLPFLNSPHHICIYTHGSDPLSLLCFRLDSPSFPASCCNTHASVP